MALSLFNQSAVMPLTRFYLFQEDNTDRYALSIDPKGCNLPNDGHPWQLRADFREAQIDEDARGEVSDYGYCLLDCRLSTTSTNAPNCRLGRSSCRARCSDH